MGIQKLNDNLNIISSLPDKPTLDVSSLKAKFDEGSITIKGYINEILIPAIEGEIVNDLITGGANKVLSAEMGKKLQNEKQGVIRYGTEVPTLAEGEIFIQIFEE